MNDMDIAPEQNIAQAAGKRLIASGARWVVRFLDRSGALAAELTGADLHREAARVAGGLAAMGLAGRPVVLAMDTGPDFLCALVGCFHAGAIAVPVPVPRPTAHINRLEGILRDCGATVVLADGNSLPHVQRHLAPLAGEHGTATPIPVAGLRANGSPSQPLPGLDRSPTDPVIIQYSSGSTRTPHGVVLHSRNLLANAAMVEARWRLGADSTLCNWLPNYHDMGLIGGILYPLLNGSRSIQMPTLAVIQRPRRWLQGITDHGVTHSGAPPFAYAHCLEQIGAAEAAGLDLSRWQVAFCGADLVPAQLLDRFRTRFAGNGLDETAVLACYGMAEATLFVAGERHWDGTPAPPWDGQGLPVAPCLLSPDTRRGVRVADPNTGTPVAAGQEGEIWLQGAHLAGGYWGRGTPDNGPFNATLAGAGGPWFRTGDMGRMTADALYITGRRKNILIVNGANVAAGDIEWLAAAQHPGLNPLAAAAFMAAPLGGDAAVLLIETRSGKTRIDDPEGVKRRIRGAVLETFGVPLQHVAFIRRGGLERTSSGKIRHHSLATRFQRGESFPEVA